MIPTAIHKAIPHADKVESFARKAESLAGRAFNATIDGYHAIHAEFRNREIKRLCTACKEIDFEHSLDPDKIGGRSKGVTEFIWPIDHVIVQRDSCTFCRLIFDALSTKLNDPLQAKKIQEFVQDDLKNLGFQRWAMEKYKWINRTVRKNDKIWPFGCSKDPPEKRESVRELIKTKKEELKHLEESNDVAMMMAASAAVSQASRIGSGKRMPQGGVALAEAAEGLMWSSALYTSSKGNRLPCWIVGTVERGSIKIDVCARGRQPRAELSSIRSFSVLIQPNKMGTRNTNGNFELNNLSDNTDILSWHYGREVHNRVDLRLAGTLLSACENSHETSCGTSRGQDSFGRFPSLASNSAPIRLLDIQTSCLVKFQPQDLPQYVALSYVWGPKKVLTSEEEPKVETLIQSNEAQWHEPWGVPATNLPETIKAAKTITENLGRRYLWIDSLCIVQDDVKDKSDQIYRMDIIYRKADITLVAADKNQSALSGIKGVTAGTSRRDFDGQVCRHISDTPGFSGLIPMSVKQNLSTWESRAWTFQEKLMSHRLLVFSEGYMVWHCRGCIAREDMTDEDAGTNQINPLLQPAFRNLEQPQPHSILRLTRKGVYQRSKTFGIYADLVHQYMGRELYLNSDILKAFTAITKQLSVAFESEFYYGMPENVIDAALLWQPSNPLYLVRRKGFPSWSWAGWRSKERTEEEKEEEEKAPNGEAKEKATEKAKERRKVLHESPFQVRTNSKGALVQAIEPEGNERFRPCTFIFKILTKPITAISIGLLEPLVSASMVPEDWEARKLPQGHRGRIEAALQTCNPGNLGQALCFEGVTASFNLEPAKSRTFRFQVKEGPIKEGPVKEGPVKERPVKEVIQDWHRVTRLNNSSSAGRVKIEYEACQSSQCEFFVLSEAQFFGSENRIEGLGYGIYNVLAFKRVCKNGKVGVIERIGIGKIKKQEWHLAEPKREILLLQ